MPSKVLIVEDEAIIAEVVAETLKEAGYEVCGIACSEAEALELGRLSRPELAVIDVRLAAGDGRLVARELRARYQTTVVMATSKSADKLEHVGALAVVPKPYRPEVIAAALQAAKKLSKGEDPGKLPDHMQQLPPE